MKILEFDSFEGILRNECSLLLIFFLSIKTSKQGNRKITGIYLEKLQGQRVLFH